MTKKIDEHFERMNISGNDDRGRPGTPTAALMYIFENQPYVTKYVKLKKFVRITLDGALKFQSTPKK